MDLADEGAALARAIGHRRAEAQCLDVKAHDYDRRGLFVEAFPLLTEIEALYTASRSLRGVAWAQYAFGQMLNQYGLLGPGMVRTEAALRNAKTSGNRTVEAWATLVLAYMAVRLDDPSLARAYVDLAAPLLEETQDLAGLANLRAIEGDAASLAGDLPEARLAYAESSDFAQAVLPAAAVHLERRLGSLARRTGDLEAAALHLAVADSMAALYGAADHLWGQSYELGLLALAKEEWAEAERYFRMVLDRIPEAWHQHQNRLDAQARLAEALALSGDLSGAATELGRAMDHLDGWRSTMVERQFRLSVLHTRKFDWDRDLGIARVLGELARGGHVETALVLSERQRSRVLLQRLTRRAALADELPADLDVLTRIDEPDLTELPGVPSSQADPAPSVRASSRARERSPAIRTCGNGSSRAVRAAPGSPV